MPDQIPALLLRQHFGSNLQGRFGDETLRLRLLIRRQQLFDGVAQ
jgi:hypothetical protein